MTTNRGLNKEVRDHGLSSICRRFVILGALPALQPADARAQQNRVLEDVTGPELLRIFAELGTDPELGTDDYDDPEIEARWGDLRYYVTFYDCDNAKREACQSLIFTVSFSLAEGTSAYEMNEWNANNRYTRAYMDEVSDPVLEMDVILYGGVTEAHLAEQIAVWHQEVDSFTDYIGWQ